MYHFRDSIALAKCVNKKFLLSPEWKINLPWQCRCRSFVRKQFCRSKHPNHLWTLNNLSFFLSFFLCLNPGLFVKNYYHYYGTQQWIFIQSLSRRLIKNDTVQVFTHLWRQISCCFPQKKSIKFDTNTMNAIKLRAKKPPWERLFFLVAREKMVQSHVAH